MKKIIITTILLAFFLGIKAQTYEYIITPYGSLFSLDIRQISENQKDTTINRRGQLDTTSVQAQLYSNIRQAYNRIARLESEILETLRLRNAYISALNSVSLNDYFAYERDRVANQLNGNWVVVINGTAYRCDIENNTRALRIAANDTSGETEDTLVGALVPRSRLYILFNPQPSFETITDENIDLYSADGTTYYGTDSAGAVYRLRFTNQ